LFNPVEFLIGLPRSYKRWVMLAADLVMLPLALWSAFAVRLSQPLPPQLIQAWWLFPLVALLGVFLFARLGLYRSVVRFMGAQAVTAVASGVVVLALVLAAAAFVGRVEGFPRTVPLIFAAIAFIYVGGSRFLVRSWYLAWHDHRRRAEPVLIFGAGGAGVQLAAALATAGTYRVVAFIDENPALHRSVISGVSVYGPEDIPALLRQFPITQLLLAIPSASRADRRRILDLLEPYPLRVQTVPSMEEIVSGQAELTQLRDLDIGDLLGRDPVPPDARLMSLSIRDKVVMVTGAGGSIGSELCRKALQQEPAALVLYEISEYALYAIEQELQQLAAKKGLTCPIYAVLGSVTNAQRVRAVIKRFGVQTIYHAAAYKHVPMVEHNVLEGVTNNVFGTRVVAEQAAAANVERMVLISTDKAVRPTNVMGATKRLAELILQDLAERHVGKTIFSMVRFGNVLGSSGSVVPKFHAQISQGGPVTVTHPEITRYFMTIFEAAELVIQAGSMAEGGDVFVLDMGDSVKIVDLARRMIHLHGFRVSDEPGEGKGIEIIFTGLRPGEKLYEELLIGEDVTGTAHPKIMRANEYRLPSEQLATLLSALQEAESRMDVVAAHKLLRAAVHEFKPSSPLCDWFESSATKGLLSGSLQPPPSLH